MENILKLTAQNIKSTRRGKGLSQLMAAKSLGISTTALSKIENGQTDINLLRLKQIADFYELPIVQLLSGNQAVVIDSPDKPLINQLKSELLEKNKEIQALQKKVIKLYEKFSS